MLSTVTQCFFDDRPPPPATTTTTTTTTTSSSSSLLLSLHHNQNENDSVDGAPPGVLLFTKQSKERSFRFWTTTRSTKTTHRITERRSHRT
mmetsp:Transcript_2969/g.9165  ORF Transcript_2969/g.9165 Transcript_2969/m.9165 type:complete len:91 (-) Transcript_2969:1805-2077(-)